jgi:hypothetical protein
MEQDIILGPNHKLSYQEKNKTLELIRAENSKNSKSEEAIADLEEELANVMQERNSLRSELNSTVAQVRRRRQRSLGEEKSGKYSFILNNIQLQDEEAMSRKLRNSIESHNDDLERLRDEVDRLKKKCKVRQQLHK